MLAMLKNIINLIWREKAKLVRQLKIIAPQPSTIENSNIVDIKSVIIEYPNILIALYIVKQKSKNS